MRAWVTGDTRALKTLTASNFRLVVGSRPAVILDARSWLGAAATQYCCRSYRFGDIYSRDLGGVAVFATQIEAEATINGQDWSGRFWVTDLWRKTRVRRRWKMIERSLSRPEESRDIPPAIRSLQLWR